MHNKTKCKKCKYHGTLGSRGLIFCDYAGLTGITCLQRDNQGNIYDSRGADFDNCAIYAEGKPPRKNISL